MASSEADPAEHSRQRLHPLRRWASWLLAPVSAEKRALLARRWEELPESLRTDWQVSGRQITHCGYTLGAAYCSFGCTHCYLPSNANRTPLPSLYEMKAQVDANRGLLGAHGHLQITGGDVVDAYWRAGKTEELIEIVRYTNERQLQPILMTHGQVLLDNPELLEQLVAVGGLRKLGLHVDITQAGRPGFPIGELRRESDLHPVRQRFVELIHQTRRRTGKHLTAAHTVTVTERNLDNLGDILTWLMADWRRLSAIRIVSFQTEAAVGRTRYSGSPVTPEAAWERVCSAVGQDLPRDNFWFGHPACSNMTSLALLYPERRAVNLMATDAESRAFWGYVLRSFGGVGARGIDALEANLRRVGLFLRHPAVVPRLLRYGRHLLRREGIALSRLPALLRNPPAILTVAMHNFMNQEEVAAPRSAEVEERLQACSFRGAVERDGTWEAVPMCSMNALERERLYEIRIGAGAQNRNEMANETTG